LSETFNFTAYGITLTVIGCVLGYLIRTFIENRLAIDRIKTNIEITQKTQAIASFRAAFAPTLAVIDVSKKVRTRNPLPSDIDTALLNALLKQAIEIELFRPYIPPKKQVVYQKAWDKYIEEAGNYGFEPTAFRTDIDDDPRKVFEDLIHNILRFADNAS
jgi:ABC-type thiamine transport system substrate-binding protein